MKQLAIITTILFSFSFCMNGQNKTTDLPVIDIEQGLKNLSRLKISDLGKTIRYIPLETPDEGLVGKNPIVKVYKNHIIVESKASPEKAGTCLLFSKKDGRFITKTGHAGQDAEAYTDSFSWMDDKEEYLYFERKPNQLMKYDMKGNFCGKVEFSSPGLASYYLITDSEIIGYFDAFNISNLSSDQYVLGIFDKEGGLKSTIPSFFPYTTPLTKDLYQTNLITGRILYPIYGSWVRAGAFRFDYTPARIIRQINPLHAARIWKSNENIRFKQDFVDTIYTVSNSKLIPSIAFHTGKHHWPLEERRSEKNNSKRIFIADISESTHFIFFQCVQGMFTQKSTLYNGLYNKKTGQTKLSKGRDAIEDDLTHFMPFTPLGMSTSGEYVSFVEAGDIMEWLEKHPEAMKNEKLSFLKNLDEEMNPIIILIK